MRKLLFTIILVATYSYPVWASARFKPILEWQGVVTHVSDGDTLFVRPASGGQPVKIRIDGMDAPEICQSYGRASRKALQNRVMGQQVKVDTRRHDNYGRVLARISLQQADVGEWMVRQGHAWSYRFRRDAGPYAVEEAQAKTAQRGLFADALALPPREFRKRHGPCQEGGATSR